MCFALFSKSSGIFGLPSANRSPFHYDVRKINSSLEIVCANREPAKEILKESTKMASFVFMY
jgi:hypothetical protein